MTYLAKAVGQGQIGPVRVKLLAIDEFPSPATKKALMHFLGMAGYYREFLKNFSTVVVPLTDLPSFKVQFDWTPQCKQAFKNVKAPITSASVLAVPHLEELFQLQVDGSNGAAGTNPFAFCS